jgi:hypothetical protein
MNDSAPRNGTARGSDSKRHGAEITIASGADRGLVEFPLRVFELRIELDDGRVLAADFRSQRQSRIDLPGAGSLKRRSKQVGFGDGILERELVGWLPFPELIDLLTMGLSPAICRASRLRSTAAFASRNLLDEPLGS